MKSRQLLITLFVGLLVLTHCSKDDLKPELAPTITSFSPAYALPGETVTITGTNFSTTLSNNTVEFNGTSAAVNTASATQLTVTAPASGTTGKISVTVSGLSDLSASDFEFLNDIPRTGLVAYYPFSGNGNCANNAAFNFNFSLANSPSLATDRFNRTNQSVNFNGTQFSFIAQQVITGLPWTISFWMDPGTLTEGDHACFYSQSSNNGMAILTRRLQDGTYYMHINVLNAGFSTPLVASTPAGYISATDAQTPWINITMTHDGANFKIYKDNEMIYTNPTTTATTPGQRFEIGDTDGANYFIGKLDDVLIYDRALSESEVTQVYQQTVSKY
jgi:hypothetical protein